MSNFGAQKLGIRDWIRNWLRDQWSDSIWKRIYFRMLSEIFSTMMSWGTLCSEVAITGLIEALTINSTVDSFSKCHSWHNLLKYQEQVCRFQSSDLEKLLRYVFIIVVARHVKLSGGMFLECSVYNENLPRLDTVSNNFPKGCDPERNTILFSRSTIQLNRLFTDVCV